MHFKSPYLVKPTLPIQKNQKKRNVEQNVSPESTDDLSIKNIRFRALLEQQLEEKTIFNQNAIINAQTCNSASLKGSTSNQKMADQSMAVHEKQMASSFTIDGDEYQYQLPQMQIQQEYKEGINTANEVYSHLQSEIHQQKQQILEESCEIALTQEAKLCPPTLFNTVEPSKQQGSDKENILYYSLNQQIKTTKQTKTKKKVKIFVEESQNDMILKETEHQTIQNLKRANSLCSIFDSVKDNEIEYFEEIHEKCTKELQFKKTVSFSEKQLKCQIKYKNKNITPINQIIYQQIQKRMNIKFSSRCLKSNKNILKSSTEKKQKIFQKDSLVIFKVSQQNLELFQPSEQIKKQIKNYDYFAIKYHKNSQKTKNQHKIIKKLQPHQNVIKLIQTSKTLFQNSEYIKQIMEYYPYTLQQYKDSIHSRQQMKKKNRSELLTIRVLMNDLLCGLAHLHQKKIIHRDINPLSLFINSQGFLVIGHFANAILTKLPFQNEDSIKKIHIMSQSDQYICSNLYRSPEQLLNKIVYSSASDIWAAGCVLFELLTGRLPFIEISSEDLLIQIIKNVGTPKTEELKVMKEIQKIASDGKSESIQNVHTCWSKYTKGKTSEKSCCNLELILQKILPKNDLSCIMQLLRATFRYDPKDRLTAVEMLKLNYFNEVNELHDT